MLFVFSSFINIKEMYSLGYLEEIILFLVFVMDEDVYGYLVSEVYCEYMDKSIFISVVYIVFFCLEKKGFISSRLGGVISECGGW